MLFKLNHHFLESYPNIGGGTFSNMYQSLGWDGEVVGGGGDGGGFHPSRTLSETIGKWVLLM